MILNTRGRYAVAAVLDIAIHGSDKPVSLSDISARQNIALNYLEQIFVRLRRAGIVTSVRGASGGYFLNKTPNEITVDQIIDGVEELIDVAKCQRKEEKNCKPDSTKCMLHDLWRGLGEEIRRYFANVSLQSVIDGRAIHAIS